MSLPCIFPNFNPFLFSRTLLPVLLRDPLGPVRRRLPPRLPRGQRPLLRDGVQDLLLLLQRGMMIQKKKREIHVCRLSVNSWKINGPLRRQRESRIKSILVFFSFLANDFLPDSIQYPEQMSRENLNEMTRANALWYRAYRYKWQFNRSWA